MAKMVQSNHKERLNLMLITITPLQMEGIKIFTWDLESQMILSLNSKFKHKRRAYNLSKNWFSRMEQFIKVTTRK